MTALRCSFLGRISRPFRPSALPRTGARQLTRAHDLRSLRCVGSAAAVEDEKKEKARPGEKKGALFYESSSTRTHVATTGWTILRRLC